MSDLESRIHLEQPLGTAEKPSTSETQDFQKTAEKISLLETAEEQDRYRDFLEERNYEANAINLQILQGHVYATQEFYPDFCLYDLTEAQLKDVLGDHRKTAASEDQKIDQKSNKLTHAKSAESLVDQLQDDGIPNTQVIERLLEAHRTKEITLPAQQFQRYTQLLETLTDNSLGAESKIVAQIIDTSDINLTAPNAFDQIISEVLKSDRLSERAKEILREKFDLKPIVLGEDLRDNLIMQRARNKKISAEISKLSGRITELDDLIEVLRRDIKRFEREIQEEIEFTKRWPLEKEVKRLQKIREELLKKRNKHNSERESLDEIPTSNSVYVRGCETNISDDHIEIRIPTEERHLRFPLNSTSEIVAEQVNTFLLYRVFEKYGIAADFFGNFDWTNRLLLLPDATSRANKLLHFLGMPGEAHILADRKLKKLDKLVNRLMKPKGYDVELSLEENGQKRLEKLGIWPMSSMTTDQFIRKLNWTKYFSILMNN